MPHILAPGHWPNLKPLAGIAVPSQTGATQAMAIILLGQDSIFPAGAVRSRLQADLPDWRWICGEDDDGARDRIIPWRASQLICGRGNALNHRPPLFIEICWIDGPWAAPGAPGHRARVKIGVPTTDDRRLSDHLIALIASSILDAQPGHGWAQMMPGGNWLDAAETTRLAQLIAGGEPLAMAAGLGRATIDPPAQNSDAASPATPNPRAIPPASELAGLPFDDCLPAERSRRLGADVLALAEAERAFADVLQHQPGLAALRDLAPEARPPIFAGESPNAGRLPTLVALCDQLPVVEWDILAQGLARLDPAGDWSWRGNDAGGIAQGRDCAIHIACEPQPIPAYLVEPAIHRAHWLKPGAGLRALRRHRGHVAITCDLDCATAGPDATRRAAKAMTLAVAVLTKTGALAGVLNAATATLFTADQLARLTAPLATNEVPIQLFVHTVFHTCQTDAISLSTAGMIPFIGREIEAWNAPGDLGFVGEKLSGVLRYLLIHGPVVGHGDTIGVTEGDRTTRCFMGNSRAERPYARGAVVPAIMLELAGPPSIGAPHGEAHVDASVEARVEAPTPPRPVPSLGQRRPPRSFGRKGA